MGGVKLIGFIVLFMVLFMSFYKLNDPMDKYNEANSMNPVIKEFESNTGMRFIEKYWIYIIAGLSLANLIIVFILYLISLPFKLSYKIPVLITSLLNLMFSYNIVFIEERNTELVNSIIFFIGYPYFWTSLILIILSIALYYKKILALKDYIAKRVVSK